MSAHLTTDDVHDWLDGLLDAAAEARALRHTETCVRCREQKDALADLLRANAELPGVAEPSRDLWAGIEARIGGIGPGGAETVMVDFPSGGSRRAPRRLSLTLPQAYAAGIAIALLSATGVWYALGARTGSVATARADSAGAPAPSMPVALASAEGAAQNELAQAALELEHTLQEGRDLLAPETLATIEQSLLTIDQAIAEARQALERDPSSPLLNRLLLSHQKNKLRILRQATSLLLPSA